MKKFKINWTIVSGIILAISLISIISYQTYKIHDIRYRSGLEAGCLEGGSSFLECRKIVHLHDKGLLKAYIAEQEWTLAQLEAQLAYLKSDEGAKNPDGWVRPQPPDFVKMTKPWWKFWM